MRFSNQFESFFSFCFQQGDDQEPTYLHYEDEDDFIDDTFDYSVGDTTIRSATTSQKYPIKCRSIYEFSVSI